jgi:tetratricopeptide (TPR) repeat protein
VLAIAVAALWPAPAAAQDRPGATAPPDMSEARRHFRQGVELYNDGDLDAALMEFATSHQLNPLPAVLYNMALVQRDLHRYADAVATLRRYLAEGAAEPEQRRTEAEELAEELDALLATVAIASDRPGADLFIDGELTGRTPVGQPLRLAAGRHELELRLDGYQTYRQRFDVHGGQRLELDIELRALRQPWFRSWWFWTAVGGAVVVIAAGVVGGVLARPDGTEFQIQVVSGGRP